MAKFFFLILLFQLGLIIGLTNGLECYSCISSLSADCSKNPEKLLDKVKCEKQCVTAVTDGGDTYRGCAAPQSIFSDLSTSCNTDLCNNKIYPSDRLQCYQCSGKTCVNPPNKDTLSPCQKYDPEDICFTEILNANKGTRGCIGDLENIPNFIEPCYEPACNDKPGISTIKCAKCDTNNEDKDCVRSSNPLSEIPNEKTCEVKTFLGQNKSTCFTYHKLDSVIRDCIYSREDYTLDEYYVTECRGDACNSASIPAENCAVCGVGTNDVSCIYNEINECQIEDTYCYACFGEHRNQTNRGCGSSIIPGKSKIECHRCQGEKGCNLKDPKKCLKCNSKTQPECAFVHNLSKISKKICETLDTMCITTVDRNGYTERDCKSEEFDEAKYLYSKECSGQFCNNQIIPEDQLICYTCRANDECGLETNSTLPLLPCSQLNEGNECYEFVQDNEYVIRGCKTDDGYKDCLKLGDECKKCNENGCNKNITISKQPELSCFNCDESDEKCQWTQKDEPTKNCTSKIPKDKKELCYSINYEDGKVSRGCSWDDNICIEKNNPTCSVCDTSNCNKDFLVAENCVQGNVTDGKGDAKKADCPAKIQYFEDQGCFVRRNGSTVTWGCRNEMTPELLAYCKTNEKMCNMCKGKSCDSMEAPSKASSIVPGVTLFSLIVTALLKNFF